MQSRLKTPCLGMCSTTYGDLVCRGCRRFAHEARDWNRYDDTSKLAVLTRLEQLQVDVAQHVVQVIDPERLFQACTELKVRGVRREFNPLCWACELLRMGGQHIHSIEQFGLDVTPAWENRSIAELSDWLVKSLYARAEAEYDRLHGTKLEF